MATDGRAPAPDGPEVERELAFDMLKRGIWFAPLVLFVAVHLLMVLLAGPLNLLGAMLSGWYRVPRERASAPDPRP